MQNRPCSIQDHTKEYLKLLSSGLFEMQWSIFAMQWSILSINIVKYLVLEYQNCSLACGGANYFSHLHILDQMVSTKAEKNWKRKH